jgi:hypothetical protein
MDTLGPAVNPFEDPPETQANALNPGPLRTQHAFHLIKTDGHRWVTLKLRSSAATASLVPYFFGGDAISGEVELDLHNTATLREIIVTVCTTRASRTGLPLTVAVSADQRPVIVEFEQPICVPQSVSVCLTSQRVGAAVLAPLPPHTPPAWAGSLRAAQFPFTFQLLEHIVLPDAGENAPPTLLPVSFDEYGARYAVEYSISVQVRRAGLSVDSWYAGSPVPQPSV